MSFPLIISDRTVQSAPQLAELFLQDVRAGGGRIVANKAPHHWITELVEAGLLERKLAVALAAALLRGVDAGAAAEAARLGVALRSPEIGALLPHALGGLDMGTLLYVDPVFPEQSVEDALLLAWGSIGDRTDIEIRAKMLERLRNAGQPALELDVVCTHGSAEEIAAWIPSILIERLPPSGPKSIQRCLRRGPRASRMLCSVFSTFPQDTRRALWQELIEAVPDLAKHPRLRKTLHQRPRST